MARFKLRANFALQFHLRISGTAKLRPLLSMLAKDIINDEAVVHRQCIRRRLLGGEPPYDQTLVTRHTVMTAVGPVTFVLESHTRKLVWVSYSVPVLHLWTAVYTEVAYEQLQATRSELSLRKQRGNQPRKKKPRYRSPESGN